MNFLIRKFRSILVDFINSEQDIPIEVKRLVLFEVLKMVEDKATIICNEEENAIRDESENSLSENRLSGLNTMTHVNAEDIDHMKK